MSNYESFVSYYGGTDTTTLRAYAAQSTEAHEPERAAMFLRLATEMEKGVVFTDITIGGKLHYVRLGVQP